MRPKMADVAERAGVSTSTVSLVLNDKPGVSYQVRAAVLEAAKELGYQLPQRRSSKTSSTLKTITIVHFAGPDEPGVEPGVSSLPASYIRGIQDFCQSQNVNWALITNYQENDTYHIGTHLLEHEELPLDGLIMMLVPSRDCRLLRRALREGIPVTVICRNWPDLPVNTVGHDHRQQARLALDYLVQLGHRKIAFLSCESYRPYDWFKDRLACYQERMKSLGEYDRELIVVGPDEGQAVKSLIAHRPDVTAIFAVNDPIAVSAMHALYQMGIWVPQQVSVIGQDDSIQALKGYPELTTVGFPHFKVGCLAAKVLLTHIEDQDLTYSKVFVQSWLIERASCASAHT